MVNLYFIIFIFFMVNLYLPPNDGIPPFFPTVFIFLTFFFQVFVVFRKVLFLSFQRSELFEFSEVLNKLNFGVFTQT